MCLSLFQYVKAAVTLAQQTLKNLEPPIRLRLTKAGPKRMARVMSKADDGKTEAKTETENPLKNDVVAIRKKLRQEFLNSPVCDAKAFVKDFHSTLLQLYTRHHECSDSSASSSSSSSSSPLPELPSRFR